MPADQQRLFLSLSAVLFFAPFVHVYKKKYSLNKEQLSFVDGYIKYGYTLWFLTILGIGGRIIQQFFPLSLLETSLTIVLYAIIGLIVVGILLVFADVELFRHSDSLIPYTTINNGRSKILRSFLPAINVHYRYTLGNYDKPYRWVKEGLLRWGTFVGITLIFQTERVSNVFLLLIIARTVTLMSGVDFLPDSEKTYLNKLYHKHGEEILCYITGFFRYIWSKIVSVLQKNKAEVQETAIGKERETTYMQAVKEEQKVFRQDATIKTMSPWHWAQYVIAGCLLFRGASFLSREVLSRNNFLVHISLLLIVIRYLIGFYYGFVPHLPIIKHILDGIRLLLFRLPWIKKYLTAVSVLFVLFGSSLSVFAQAPYAGIGGTIDLAITEIQVNETYPLNARPNVGIVIENQGDGTLSLPSSDAIPQGFIRCLNGTEEVLSSNVIASTTIIAGDSMTISNLSLPQSLTDTAQEVTLSCTINQSNIFVEQNTANNTAIATFLVEPSTAGRFGTSINDAVAEIETKIDTPTVQLGTDGVQSVIFGLLDDFVIPLAIVGGVILAIFGFFKLMTSDSDEEIGKATNYLIYGVIGIIIMVSAKFIGEVVYFDLFGQGLLTELSGVQLSQEIYNKILYPFLKIAMYIGVGILFIILIIKTFSFVFGNSDESITKARNIIVRSTLGILLILGSKRLVEAIYGSQELVINDNALSPADIGGSFFEGFSFPFLYEIINWVIGITALIILIIILVQTFKLLLNPQSDENIKGIGNSILYILAGVLLIGASYLIVNFLIVN